MLILTPKVGHSRPQVGPRVSPKSAKSRPKVGSKSAKSLPKVNQKSAKSRPKVGPKSVQSQPMVSQSHPRVRPNSARIPSQKIIFLISGTAAKIPDPPLGSWTQARYLRATQLENQVPATFSSCLLASRKSAHPSGRWLTCQM